MRALVELDRHLDPDSYPVLADAFNLSRAEVRGVASFYDDFQERTPAAHEVRICRAEACQAAGNASLLAAWEQLVLDRALVVERPVYCLGLCACAPAISIDGRPYAEVTPEQLTDLVGDLDG